MSFELRRRDPVERFVNSTVVEPIDVLECLPFDVLNVAPWSLAMDEFGLVETIEALGQRIIVTVALGPDRRDDLLLTESLGVANTEVLTASVIVMDQSRESEIVARVDRHLECVQGEVTAQRRGRLPPHNAATEHVDDERDVDPSGVRLHVGQIRHPETIGCRSDELSIDEVLGAMLVLITDGRDLELATASSAAEPQVLHQSSHRAVGDRDPLAVELLPDLHDAVDTEVVIEDPNNLGLQDLVAPGSVTGFS